MHFWGQRHFVTHRKVRVREFLRQLNGGGISWNFGALVNTKNFYNTDAQELVNTCPNVSKGFIFCTVAAEKLRTSMKQFSITPIPFK